MKQAFLFCIVFCLLQVNCSMTRVVLPSGAPQIHDGITAPRLVSAPDIEYPDLGEELDIQGVITLKAKVGLDGRADSISILERKFNYSGVMQRDGTIKPVAEIFDSLAIRFVRESVYEPATREGKPIAVWVAVPVRWELQK